MKEDKIKTCLWYIILIYQNSKPKQNKWSSREEMDYGYISLNVKFQIGDVK